MKEKLSDEVTQAVTGTRRQAGNSFSCCCLKTRNI